SGWDPATPLQDPMCGSGTLVIEAAMLARNIIPGLLERRYGFMNWPDYDAALHQRIIQEAREAIVQGEIPPLRGSDQDPAAIAAAKLNARHALVGDDIQWEVATFEEASVFE